ncbi:MAG: 2-oxoacid:ferredoxin oxidoreductase subunit beta [Bacteriovoracaceae bacterium]|jgi:2-oxoglutarate ferredoxin oxidoreductase subunit beta|nr:2-oxoacid:ferredoxin oxidoreductase subunit beta [Bacteriovoracaceae bacterium]
MSDVVYKKKDFASDQQVKWCPGCGDYAILSSVQQAMAKIGVAPHNTAVISGIGCSSRFPYYMGTYGMHTIHGRAPAFATGLKVQNPDLSVWLITGDGDGLSIGGNHLAHIIRRNVDVNLILFNNEIYGLTKGQYSPTSKEGIKTKSTPYGSVDHPFNPADFVMGSGSTYFARTIDTDPKHMMETFIEASKHKGCSVIEVYQNCVIFNDKVHDAYTNRATRDDHSIRCVHGEKLIFGKDKDKGIIMDGFNLKVVVLDGNEDKIVTFDKHNKILSQLLTQKNDELPVAIGTLYTKEDITSYEQDVNTQIAAQKNDQSIQQLLESANTWQV